MLQYKLTNTIQMSKVKVHPIYSGRHRVEKARTKKVKLVLGYKYNDQQAVLAIHLLGVHLYLLSCDQESSDRLLPAIS